MPLDQEEEYLVGLDHRIGKMMELMDIQVKDVWIIGIHGVGGVGRTTLAKAIYIKSHHKFQASSFIENIREVYKSKGPMELQKKLIQDFSHGKHKIDENISSKAVGMNKQKASKKSVFLVLDDKNQLDAFAVKRQWLHPGSRIIVATRQAEILKFAGLQDDAIYMVEELDGEESLQLFKSHAFGDQEPQEEYINLAKEVASICNGLPLVFQVFGSLFKTAETPEEWNNYLKELRLRQREEFHKILKISYEGLNDQEKIIFLDITCLHVGKNSEDAIWEDVLYTNLTIKRLQNRSLVKINMGEFEMHDQIRAMGREIVSTGSLLHPGKPSRLWREDDLVKALTKLQRRSPESGAVLDFTGRAEGPSIEKMALQSNMTGPSKSPLSSSHGRFEYDVFMSFRGEDTRNNFAGLLRYRLDQQCRRTFFDEEDLHKGERIEEILEAISRSKILVPIFSQRYAESNWCLREVAKMVKCCCDVGQERLIIPIFFNVNPEEVRRQSGPFAAAFQKHQTKRMDSNGEVHERKHALRYVGGISGFHLQNGCFTLLHLFNFIISMPIFFLNQRQLINSITAEIEKVLTTKQLFYEEEYLVGLEIRVKKMMEHLDFQGNNVRIIGIHGIGDVLLVLDDVDDRKVLNALAGNISRFHSGSRIIITTRQDEILKYAGLQDEAIYMLEELDEKEAFKLFNYHAFGGDESQGDYFKLSKEVVAISNGLPLILEVFGSLFKTAKSLGGWKKLLKELRRRQHSEVHEQLRICYDSLNDNEKLIFLDIACLLVKKNSDDAIFIWEDHNLSPNQAIRSFQNRSLIKINKGKFLMHDQIGDMGREIVLRESPLRHCSRLWCEEDLEKVLMKYQARLALVNFSFFRGNKSQGILLNLREECKIELRSEAFELMPELRILLINFAIFNDCDFRHFPASLKWLEWKSCPLATLPLESKFKGIVVLDLSRSFISQLWSESTTRSSSNSTKESFDGLKVLDLSCCACLSATPNFAMAPNLEKLVFDECSNLKEVDDSIGSLKMLVFLSMRECVSLEKLPNKVYELSSLVIFNLKGCSRLVSFPQLPPTKSTNGLPNLEELILRGCESFEFLPRLPEFHSLRSLHIDGCQRLGHRFKHLL
ncbi:TMV resistance protein [Nymphaea thermarum]|nr:TMV resistance protein [Nymphaea thermarum]